MRMRLLSLGTIALATLMGCAAGPRVENVEPEGPPAMRVWIGYPIGSSHVYPVLANRAAHVAMFEIIPGRGVTMVYPRSTADVFASDAHYANLAIQPGRALYQSDPFGLASFEPRYYYAVASAAPLNLSRLLYSLVTMRRVLDRMYASYRPYDVIDRLTKYVVPKQADEDWATDLFIDYPVPAPVPAVLAQRLVVCANGRIIQVPRNYPYYGCPGDAEPAVAAVAAKPPTKQLTVDSASRPRLPQIRDGQRTANAQGRDVGTRRAEAGARRSYPRGMARAPSQATEGYRTDRYRDTRGESARDRSTASRDEPASGGSGRSQAAERGDTGPVRTESGERKPNPNR